MIVYKFDSSKPVTNFKDELDSTLLEFKPLSALSIKSTGVVFDEEGVKVMQLENHERQKMANGDPNHIHTFVIRTQGKKVDPISLKRLCEEFENEEIIKCTGGEDIDSGYKLTKEQKVVCKDRALERLLPEAVIQEPKDTRFFVYSGNGIDTFLFVDTNNYKNAEELLNFMRARGVALPLESLEFEIAPERLFTELFADVDNSKYTKISLGKKVQLVSEEGDDERISAKKDRLLYDTKALEMIEDGSVVKKVDLVYDGGTLGFSLDSVFQFSSLKSESMDGTFGGELDVFLDFKNMFFYITSLLKLKL